MNVARRIFEWLLWAYPPHFRRRFGAEMSALFAEAYADQRRRGPGAVVRLWFRTFRDLATNVPTVWFRWDATLTDKRLTRRPSTVRMSSSPPPRRVENVVRDMRMGVRQLIHNPLYATLAIATLALGIGANSAIFSVVNGILLRPLPYEDQQDLVVVWTALPNRPEFPVSVAEWLDYRAATTSLTDVAVFGADAVTAAGNGNAERVSIVWASQNLFGVLGTTPIAGRVFTPEETQPGGPRAAILSYNFWTTRYGGDPDVLGRTIVLDNQSAEIVGVMPRGFEPPGADPQLYLALQTDRGSISDRSGHWLTAVGRLNPTATLDRAISELDGLLIRWETEFADVHPNDPEIHPLHLEMLESQLFGAITPTMKMLLGAVGLVLLLACANVANLALARGEGRSREIGIRRALGASRGRLFTQGLVESLMLSLAGGAVGLLLAKLGTDLLLALEPGRLPRIDEVGLDATVVGFTAAITVGTGLLFGLIPTLRTARTDAGLALRDGGRGRSASREAHRTLNLLAVSQMALAVLLLVGSGLLIKSFYRLQQVDPGFDAVNRIGFDVRILEADYPNREDGIQFFQSVLTELRAIPGVETAAAARGLPLRNRLGTEGFFIEGYVPPNPDVLPSGYYHSASAGYFRTMGIPVLQGREFGEFDRLGGAPVAIVNEAFAAQYFENGHAVGHRLRASFAGPDGLMREIVGIVGNVRHHGITTVARPEVYLPLAQTPDGWALVVLRTPGFVVRTSLDADALAPLIRDAVRNVDPNVPVTNVGSMHAAVSQATAGERFIMLLVGTFALVALGIAAVGVYGVIAFGVARRRQEIGIRLALGAAPGLVMREVLQRGLSIALVGGVVGLGMALAASRIMETLVYGIGVRDVTVFAGSIALLAAVAVAASAVPALRASHTSPSTTLRDEG